MTSDEHTTSLGMLLGNMHALEIRIRGFLSSLPGAQKVHDIHGVDLLSLPVGTELPESNITNYDYLSTLVTKFNELATIDKTPLIDENVVNLRNTLMHGCVFARAASHQLHILKFSKPVGGKCKIETSEDMTVEWFSRGQRATIEAIRVVAKKMDPAATL